MTKDRQDRAIQIERQTRAVSGQIDKSLQQSIIDAMQLFPEPKRRLRAEAAQGLWIGKTRQTREVLKGTVGAQERRGFDAVQTQHDQVHQSQYHLRGGVAAVAAGIVQVLGQEVTDLRASQKFVEEVDAAEVSQTPVITGDFEITR